MVESTTQTMPVRSVFVTADMLTVVEISRLLKKFVEI